MSLRHPLRSRLMLRLGRANPSKPHCTILGTTYENGPTLALTRQNPFMRCYQCAVIQFTMSPTRFHVKSTQIFSPKGVYYYRRARTHVTHSRTHGPIHTHTLTVAHTVALTPYSIERIYRAEEGDVAKALNRCTTRNSARMRNLR